MEFAGNSAIVIIFQTHTPDISKLMQWLNHSIIYTVVYTKIVAQCQFLQIFEFEPYLTQGPDQNAFTKINNKIMNKAEIHWAVSILFSIEIEQFTSGNYIYQ